jgi:raffinose/stachyose/melibiose transport system permease protein
VTAVHDRRTGTPPARRLPSLRAAARPVRRLVHPGLAPSGTALGIAVSLLPGVALFATFFLVPLGVVAVTSMSDWNPLGLAFNGLRNYRTLFGDDAFWQALKNTMLFSAAALFVQMPVGVGLAIILSRRFRGWRILRTLYFLPNSISYAALALVYLTFYNPRYGLLNQVLGAAGRNGSRDWLFDIDTALPAVAATWVLTAGLIMILVMAEIDAIPPDVTEAARVDGASPWQVTRRITLPLLRNVIGVCSILALLSTLTYFDGVYIMTSGGPANHTLTMSLYAFQQYSQGNWGYANAIGVLLLCIGVIVIVAVRRVFRIGDRDF